MLGYVTRDEALNKGMTHHGKYYGIPIWIGDVDSHCVSITAKFIWLEPLVTVASYIERFLMSEFLPYEEPHFIFEVGKPIK